MNTNMKKLLFIASTVAIISVSIHSLLKQRSQTNDLENQILVNYYCKIIYEEGYTSSEMVLTTTNDIKKVRLDVYTKEDDIEQRKTFYLPVTVIDECMQWIKKCEMNTWNNLQDPSTLDGKILVCKYLHNGNYIRVSTECMPENGDKMLEEIANIISNYVSDEYELKKRVTYDL